jgi:hypothetical protein
MAMLPLQPTAGRDERNEKGSGAVRTLCCEGHCSRANHIEERLRISKLRAAGFSPEDVRSQVSSRLQTTSHAESRRLVNERTRTIVVFFMCLICGHERQYGVEEMQ